MRIMIRTHHIGLVLGRGSSALPVRVRAHAVHSLASLPAAKRTATASQPLRSYGRGLFRQICALSYVVSSQAREQRRSYPSLQQPPRRCVQDFVSKYTRPQEYNHGEHRVQVTAAENTWLSVNDIISRRSVLLFPTSFMLWKARLPSDISSSSLALMKVVFPTLEMLVVGCGRSIHDVDIEIRRAIAEEFRLHGTVVEFMDTRAAVSTFNVMNAEDRQVGAALLLPEPGPNEDDRVDLQALFEGSDSGEAAIAEEEGEKERQGGSDKPVKYRKPKEIFSELDK